MQLSSFAALVRHGKVRSVCAEEFTKCSCSSNAIALYQPSTLPVPAPFRNTAVTCSAFAVQQAECLPRQACAAARCCFGMILVVLLAWPSAWPPFGLVGTSSWCCSCQLAGMLRCGSSDAATSSTPTIPLIAPPSCWSSNLTLAGPTNWPRMPDPAATIAQAGTQTTA